MSTEEEGGREIAQNVAVKAKAPCQTGSGSPPASHVLGSGLRVL